METNNSKQVKVLNEAKDILDMNKYYERSIILLLTTTSNTVVDAYSNTTLEFFDKQKVSLLSSFYEARTLNDLTANIVLLKKGNKLKVHQGVKDKTHQVLCYYN